MLLWPSGLRRWFKTRIFCDVGSNPTAADSFTFSFVEVNCVLKRSKYTLLTCELNTILSLFIQ